MTPKQTAHEENSEQVSDLAQQVENLRAGDADLQEEAVPRRRADEVLARTTTSRPLRWVPLRMGGRGGTHNVSDESKRLIEEEVTLDDLQRMTERFYEKALSDSTLESSFVHGMTPMRPVSQSGFIKS